MEKVIITDASFRKPNRATVAIIANGKTKSRAMNASNSIHAELLSIKIALDYIAEKGISNALIINDNQCVVGWLNNNPAKKSLRPLVAEAKKIMERTNTRVKWQPRRETAMADFICDLPPKQAVQLKFKTIALPRLDGIKPTLISTLIKLMEEIGELSQVIGKMRGMSGEEPYKNQQEVYSKIAGELLDVAQTCITFMFVLEEEYGISIDSSLRQHIRKLKNKKYIL